MTDTAGVSHQMESEITSAEANLHEKPDSGSETPDTSQPGISQETAPNAEGTTAPQPEGVDSKNDNDMDYEATLEELTQQIESLKAQLEERTGQYVRIAADFDNFRKRTQKEKEDLEQQVKCSTVVELLPIVDNFERARSQIKPQTDSEMTIHKSYQGVYKDLVDRLKRIGVAPMRSEGKEFDPNMHEAVMREATDEYAEGTVMEELVRGYLLGDRVLRHAMVKVAAASETSMSVDGDRLENTEV